MKKAFNLVLPMLLLALGYLVYMQWFSPSRPLQIRLSLKTEAPPALVSLPIKDFSGTETTLQIRNDSYSHTLFLVDGMFMGKNFYFSSFKNYHELLAKQGYRIVYLWAGGVNTQDDENSKLAAMLQNDRYATHAILDPRKTAQYQALGLQISTFPFMFVCDSEGKVIYQHQYLMANQLMETLSSLRIKEAAPK